MNQPRTRTLAALLLTALVGCGGDAGGGGSILPDSPLFNPQSEAMTAAAPDVFQVRFETSEGDFIVEVHKAWAPNGADRFHNLVSNGYYDGVRFFRVIEGFMAQFGIHGDPQVSSRWTDATISDDPVVRSNTRGTLSFAMTGQPNSRSAQVFINFGDNANLDELGFAPFAEVVEGMDVVDQLYSGYGEGAPSGRGPSQAQVQAEGNRYLESQFPELDYIVGTSIVGG